MAVVERKRKSGSVYYAVNEWLGKQVSENCGPVKRIAKQRDNEMKREIKAGTYKPGAGGRDLSFRQYSETWLAARRTRTAKDEKRWLERHVLTRDWFADRRLADITTGDVVRLVRQIQSEGKLSPKSISNLHGVVHVLFRDARFEGRAGDNPAAIPPDILDRSGGAVREVYNKSEVVALVRHAEIPWPVQVLNALCFLAGLREGEACGLRCSDLDTATGPLWALEVSKQYGGAPLKTSRPRVVPVHPELRAILEGWLSEGFELWTGRRPAEDDFLVPRVGNRSKTAHWTRSTFYKAFTRACAVASVEGRSLHSARHTFITLCRRGGARPDHLEKVTHNAKGKMIDRYTHLDWQPLCEAVTHLNLVTHPDLPPPTGTLGSFAARTAEHSGANPPKRLRANSDQPGSIPGASTTARAKTSRNAKERQEKRQESWGALGGSGELDDFEIALAEAAERGAVGRLLSAPLRWPAVVRVALFRRQREVAHA